MSEREEMELARIRICRIEAAAIEAVADVRAGRITMDEARARMRQIAEAIAKEMLDSIYGRP